MPTTDPCCDRATPLSLKMTKVDFSGLATPTRVVPRSGRCTKPQDSRLSSSNPKSSSLLQSPDSGAEPRLELPSESKGSKYGQALLDSHETDSISTPAAKSQSSQSDASRSVTDSASSALQTDPIHASEVGGEIEGGNDSKLAADSCGGTDVPSGGSTSTILFPLPATKIEHETWQYYLAWISTATLRHMPQHLLRVTSDSSQGLNTPDHFQAGALLNHLQSPVNFFSLSKDQVRDTLLEHLRTRHVKSHWISFTSSIAFAISRALTLRDKGHRNIRIWIIDTFEIEGNPLIVHAHRMLKPYKVRLNKNLSYDVTREETSRNEFLVWDEIRVKSSSVSLEELLQPGTTIPDFVPKGLLVLNPCLECKAKERVKEEGMEEGKIGGKEEGKTEDKEEVRAEDGKPRKKSGRKPHQKVAKSPAQMRKDLYGLDQEIEDWQKEQDQAMVSGVLSARPKDNRYDVDSQTIEHWKYLMRPLDPRFRLPMMVALLSMRADHITKTSIVKEIVDLSEKPYHRGQYTHHNLRFNYTNQGSADDPMFADLKFWRTTLLPRCKPEMQTFEDIFSDCCKGIAGNDSVSSGPSNDKRAITPLDADPRLSNTEEGICVVGSEPTTQEDVLKITTNFSIIHKRRQDQRAQERARLKAAKNAARRAKTLKERSETVIESVKSATTMPDSTREASAQVYQNPRKRPLPVWAKSARSKKLKLYHGENGAH